jgi:hypothetical protein
MGREPLFPGGTLLRWAVLAATLAAMAAADESREKRVAEVLRAYAGSAAVGRHVEAMTLPQDLDAEETRAVLALLEARVGRASLRARIRRSPSSVATLRLVPAQAFLSLLDVLLEPKDTNRVLQSSITHLAQRNVYGFTGHRRVRRPFFALPNSLIDGSPERRALLRALEQAIRDEGYPLPPGRAEALAVAHVPDLEEALRYVRRFRPAPDCGEALGGT